MLRALNLTCKPESTFGCIENWFHPSEPSQVDVVTYSINLELCFLTSKMSRKKFQGIKTGQMLMLLLLVPC